MYIKKKAILHAWRAHSSHYVTIYKFPTIDQLFYLKLWNATIWHKIYGKMGQVQTERVNGDFLWMSEVVLAE